MAQVINTNALSLMAQNNLEQIFQTSLGYCNSASLFRSAYQQCER